MDELMQILTENCPDTDFELEDRLIDDDVLDSLELVVLVGAINDAFDVSITAEELTPENFNSVEAIYALIQRLKHA